MALIICLLRAINVGGHNIIKMEALRARFESLGLRGVQTYVQSGNIVFQSGEQDLKRLQDKIQGAIERKFDCRPEVILRTAADWKKVIAANPFARRPGMDPRKLLVMFLAGQPVPGAEKALRGLRASQEEMKLVGRELFIYCPKGMGQAKISWSAIDKALGTCGTGRNWNTVTKLFEMAQALEAGE
jgi:uncharacterized protein (DUF1697 family)